MLSLFKSPRFSDPQLGMLERSRGLSRGSTALYPGVIVPLALAGTRTEPDHAALRAASDLIAQFPSLRTFIEKALFEHYEPYAQALTAGEPEVTGEPLPKLSGPSEVWAHVSPVFLSGNTRLTVLPDVSSRASAPEAPRRPAKGSPSRRSVACSPRNWALRLPGTRSTPSALVSRRANFWSFAAVCCPHESASVRP